MYGFCGQLSSRQVFSETGIFNFSFLIFNFLCKRLCLRRYQFLVVEVVDFHGFAYIVERHGRGFAGFARALLQHRVDFADAGFVVAAAFAGSSTSLSTAISSRLTFTSPSPPRR